MHLSSLALGAPRQKSLFLDTMVQLSFFLIHLLVILCVVVFGCTSFVSHHRIVSSFFLLFQLHSNATIKPKHIDPKHLEQVLRQAIVRGQDRTRQPFTKILIVVEVRFPFLFIFLVFCFFTESKPVSSLSLFLCVLDTVFSTTVDREYIVWKERY